MKNVRNTLPVIALSLSLTACGSTHHDAPDATISTSTTSSSTSNTPTPSASASASATSAPVSSTTPTTPHPSATSRAASPRGTTSSTTRRPRTPAPATSAHNDARSDGEVSSSVRESNTSAARSIRGSNTKASEVPVSISVPSIGLHHSIHLTSRHGSSFQPAPGQIDQFLGFERVLAGQKGVSILAGHVTYYGADVFYNLGRMKAGTTYTIRYADGSKRVFRVQRVESINKYQLEHDQRLWGNSTSPVVALVTCDSNSGWANARHHLNNLVVWSVPA